jgi:hypothetical protein
MQKNLGRPACKKIWAVPHAEKILAVPHAKKFGMRDGPKNFLKK